MPGNVRVGGVWREVAQPYVRVGGVWREVSEAWTRVGGVWRKWFEPASAFELISTQQLGSTATSVTFSSIPQDYTHLQLRIVARRATNLTGDVRLRINGATTNDYSHAFIRGSGSSANSVASFGQGFITTAQIDGRTIFSYGAYITDILDYSSTSKNTAIRQLGGQADNPHWNVGLYTGAYYSTSAVTSIEIFEPFNGFAAASRFSLYGIKGT